MPFIGLFQFFENSGVGVWIRASTYAFAVLECVHLMGMVCLLGSLVAIDMRLIGFGMKRQPVAKVASSLAPVTWIGMGTMIVTGLLLFSSEAMKCYDNAAFPWKMGCLSSACSFTSPSTGGSRISMTPASGLSSAKWWGRSHCCYGSALRWPDAPLLLFDIL